MPSTCDDLADLIIRTAKQRRPDVSQPDPGEAA
jgi:hypothetical protein